jgi:hypothetical protein
VARAVLDALPLTGCVLGSAADAVSLAAEASHLTWADGAMCWCLGAEAGEAARHTSPVPVEELDGASSGSELARRIAARRGSRWGRSVPTPLAGVAGAHSADPK